mmetsp:Transcript_26417/g.55177  ORF Transcript_26417/g.55177 Transcript_26417/m.55177 type:complete len:292 (+) Transcript_26417:48-923(+)
MRIGTISRSTTFIFCPISLAAICIPISTAVATPNVQLNLLHPTHLTRQSKTHAQHVLPGSHISHDPHPKVVIARLGIRKASGTSQRLLASLLRLSFHAHELVGIASLLSEAMHVDQRPLLLLAAELPPSKRVQKLGSQLRQIHDEVIRLHPLFVHPANEFPRVQIVHDQSIRETPVPLGISLEVSITHGIQIVGVAHDTSFVKVGCVGRRQRHGEGSHARHGVGDDAFLGIAFGRAPDDFLDQTGVLALEPGVEVHSREIQFESAPVFLDLDQHEGLVFRSDVDLHSLRRR